MSEKIREKLEQLGYDHRFKFSGKFKKYGFKFNDRRKTHASPTILLVDVKLIDGDDEIDMTDHLWFNLTKGFKYLGILADDDIISLYGRVTEYTKGYQGSKTDVDKPIQIDYKIERPSRVKLELSHPLTGPNMYRVWPDKAWETCNMIYDTYSLDYIKRGILTPYPDQNLL